MLNRACLQGRLTADPELRRTSNDISVCSFTLAVNRTYTPKGQEQQTDFINIVAWRNTAEFAGKYFVKGQLVAIEGSIQTRSYTDRDGNNRKAFEVVADNVYFAESKRDRTETQGANTYTSGLNVMPPPSYKSASVEYSDFEELPDDDELPF